MKNKEKIVLYIVIILMLVGMSHLLWSASQLRVVSNDNFKAQEDTIQRYQDKLGRSVSEKQALTISNKQLKYLNDSLKISIKGMKPVVITKTKLKIQYRDTTIIKYDKPIDIQFKRLFSRRDKYITILGKVSNRGVSFDRIELDLKLINNVGFERKNIFCLYKPVSKITSDNPYVKITKIETYVVKSKNSILSNKWVWLGAGVLTGVLIAN